MDEKQFFTIDEKLGIIIKLLAIQMIKDKDFREQVMLLSSIGMPYKEIAELTGKTENNVKVTLHLIKKAKKERSRRK